MGKVLKFYNVRKKKQRFPSLIMNGNPFSIKVPKRYLKDLIYMEMQSVFYLDCINSEIPMAVNQNEKTK